MTMDFIKPQHHHLQQVMEWVKDPKVFDIWAGPGFRFPFTTESFIEDLKLDELHSRVLVDNDQIQAFGQVYKRLNRTHLGRLVVNPQAQGQGIGTELVERLMLLGDELLNAKGYSLFVLERNIRAKDLYQRFGFKSTDYPEIMPLPDCLYMIKDHE